MDIDTIIPFFIGGCAFAAVMLRTFWDLKTKAPMSDWKLWGMRALLAVCLVGMLFGTLDTYNRSRNATIESRQNLMRILEEVRAESRRLVPQDFQVRVYAKTRATRLKGDRLPMPPVHVSGAIGTVGLSFDLADLGPGATDDLGAGRGASPGSTVRFASLHMTTYGLEVFPFLESLNGHAVEVRLPLKRLAPSEHAWFFQVEVLVRGRLFTGSPDGDGKVRIEFSGL